MDNDIIIERIEFLSNIKGVSKTKALTESGAGKDFISNIKKGQTPSITKLQKIADYFGTSVDYILGNDTIQVYDENNNLVVLDDETRDFINQLRSQPEMKMLFSVTRKANKDDIIKAVKIIEALKETSED